MASDPTDIITRLRAGEPCGTDPCRDMKAASGCLCAAAADEIERLRANAISDEANQLEAGNAT